MELKDEALSTLADTRRFFERTTRCLAEADSAVRPHPATMTAAGQMAHAAQVVDWFGVGAFDDAWNLDFAAQQAETDRVTSLAEARAWFDRAWTRITERIASATDAELAAPMAENPILGTRPRIHVVSSIVDHTGHHRGALAVYARLAGKVPEMPYGED